MILREYIISGLEKPVTICPIGDIQWVGRRSDIAYDHLKEHIAECLTYPNPLFIGMGDYTDFASPSNREAIKHARVYDTGRRVINDKAKELADEVYDQVLEPTKGKWLGMLRGHHWFPLFEGGTTDKYLASKLGAEYLGTCSIVCLTFKGPESLAMAQQVKIYAHHGCGESVFPYGPITKLYRVAPNWNVDIFLMGHQTKKAKADFDRIDAEFPGHPYKPRLSHRTIHLVGTGGWSKGYQEEDPEGTYVEAGMMNPVALGQPIITVNPRWRESTTHGHRVWDPRIKATS